MVRLLKGDGIHDHDELSNIPESAFDGLEITWANEDEYDGNTWLLDRELSRNDGVMTQSVTLASEAALLAPQRFLLPKQSAVSLIVYRMMVIHYLFGVRIVRVTGGKICWPNF